MNTFADIVAQNTSDAETRRLAAIMDMNATSLGCWASGMSQQALDGLRGDLATAERVFSQLEGPAAARPGSCTCRTRFARNVLGDTARSKRTQYRGAFADSPWQPLATGGLAGDPSLVDEVPLGSWLSKAFRSVTKAASNVFGIVRNVAGGFINNIPIVGPLVGGLLDRFGAPGQTPAPGPSATRVVPVASQPIALPPSSMPYTTPPSGGGGGIFQTDQPQPSGGLSLNSPIVLVGLAGLAVILLTRR